MNNIGALPYIHGGPLMFRYNYIIYLKNAHSTEFFYCIFKTLNKVYALLFTPS